MKICAALMAVLVIGAAVVVMPVPYHYSIDAEQEGDSVSYTFESNVRVDATAMLISSTGRFDIDNVVMFCDKEYTSPVRTGDQMRFLSFMYNQCGTFTLKHSFADAQGIRDTVYSEPPSRTALLFASGAFPDTVYDGTADCPLMEWLESGGTVVNIGGTMGRYICHEGPEEPTEVTGYGQLFAGIADDSVFNDSDSYLYTTDTSDTRTDDALNTYFNEYTYGMDVSGLTDYRTFGYVSNDGWSCCTLFASGNGMVLNVGMSLENGDYLTDAVAQILASGMDWTSEIEDIDSGKTRLSGTFLIGTPGHHHVYGFAGSSRPVFADRVPL